ncbi:MAG: alpha-L-glutamate ligase-like protein [Pseudomonadales bacterium]|nr:alpha-L-glutamate ligase-like protein [Pseudomonadales bacterium]
MWISPRKLTNHGVLGMNRRNVHYIGHYNDRSRYPLVDNKLNTKIVAREAGLAIPELIHVVKTQHEIETLEKIIAPLTEFVAKPAQGSGGKGILVVRGREEDQFIKSNGSPISTAEIKRHLTNTISGLHSLGGRTDIAFLEELVRVDESFKAFSHEGVPDIRLIIFKGFPIMGMLRLTTRVSDGKANLHQGAIGVGLGIASGKPVRAVQHDRVVTAHPDTGADLDELRIPDWPELLHLAASTFEVTELGYLGCDIVIDKDKGPLILELNARPGLSIQLANDAGLIPRLEAIEALDSRRMGVAERVAYSQANF